MSRPDVDVDAAVAAVLASPVCREVRDVLTHHLREGAGPAEAVETAILVLDIDATQALAAIGLWTLFRELVETGEVTLP